MDSGLDGDAVEEAVDVDVGDHADGAPSIAATPISAENVGTLNHHHDHHRRIFAFANLGYSRQH